MSEPITNSVSIRPFTAASFYQYLAEKKLMAVKCKKDNRLYIPPKAVVCGAGADDLEWVQLSGKGKLSAFTVIYVAPSFMNNAGFSRDNPYISAIIQLDEGLGICSRVIGLDAKKPESIQIGMPLVADYVAQFDGKNNKIVLAFRPEIKEELTSKPTFQAVIPEEGEDMRLKNKIAVITGGAAGIGKVTAEKFAKEGATVIICDINEAVGQEVVKILGPNASFYKVNVGNRQEVQTFIEAVIAKYERIDVLVNNAGIVRDNQLVKYKDGAVVKQMPESDFDLVVQINLKGTFNCTQVVVPFMIKQKNGVILNASSIVGLDGNFGQTNYVATKSGVIGMTKVWARELGQYNIRVNAIAPGFTATDILNSMPAKVLEDIKSHTPLKRLGQPTDIANAYAFLASDEASFISGTVLRVDGGSVLGT